MWKVQRATKYLDREDRAMLMEMLVHPHLEYGQNALKEVTRAAEEQVRRAYNLTARVTAQTGRTRPALKALGWAGWRKRRTAVRAKMVMSVWATGKPAALASLLPPERERAMEPRGAVKGEMEEGRVNPFPCSRRYRG